MKIEEKIVDIVIEDEKKSKTEFKPVENYNPVNNNDILATFCIFSIIFIFILLIIICIFTICNANNPNIIKGVYIKGIDVSGLSKDEAFKKVSDYINSSIPDEILLRHEDFESSISPLDLSVYFNVRDAVEVASNIGKEKNVFIRDITILQALIFNINVEPGFILNDDELQKNLLDISSKLPDKVINSSYYIDENTLVLTSGKTGSVINIPETSMIIKDYIKNFNSNDLKKIYIELITYELAPNKLDLDNIYNEIYKEPINAYFTQNPYSVIPSENGLDFGISLNDAKKLLDVPKEEYEIPLKVLYPEVTTSMIGTDAFPDVLSEFSTNYSATNTNRTTNLILASNKINGTVLMPEEIFSYNKVVGERTIEAGYREAPIYVSGRVENGIRRWYMSNNYYII